MSPSGAAEKTNDGMKKAGDDSSNAISSAWHMFRGAGESLRGNINRFVDNVGGTISAKRPVKKDATNEEVMRGGEREFNQGEHEFPQEPLGREQ